MSNSSLVEIIQQLVALNQQQRFADSQQFAQNALIEYPNQPQILMLLAFAQYHLADISAAQKQIELAFNYGEKSAYANYVYGLILEETNQLELAKNAFFNANKLDPSYTYCRHYLVLVQNLANSTAELLQVLKQYDDFIFQYPNDYMAYQNRSVVLKKLGLYELALQDIEYCLTLKPDFALGWCNKALTLNLLGDLKQGFADYEWRLKAGAEDYSPPSERLKLWQGGLLQPDQKLLIMVEQGFGDNIQFVRYALFAKQRGFNIAVLNHQGIEELLDYNLQKYGIETVKNGGFLPKEMTHYIPMMSLPFYFQTTLDNIPFANAYLAAQPEFIQKWQTKISPKTVNIGLVWAGSAKHNNNLARSLNLANLLPLLDCNAQFHCLQKVVKNSEKLTACSSPNLHFWDEEIADFSDTAGMIAQMDLVISVDTSAAHLAAAMGKPTWILLGFDPDFRWLLERRDSPWYASATLFRQDADYDWQKVIQQVLACLQKNWG